MEGENCNESKIKLLWEKMPPTMASMIFASNQSLVIMDRDEVLQYLPNYKGKRILEMTSGIGRFTGLLAKDALHVTAVDFISNYHAINEKENGRYDNITFICADAMEIDFPAGSFDIVFSGWLYCNLDDSNVRTITERTLKWIAPGGYIFFREKCASSDTVVSSGYSDLDKVIDFTMHDVPDDRPFENVGYVRRLSFYCLLLWGTSDDKTCFRNIRVKNSQAFIKLDGNPVEGLFVAQRVSLKDAKCLMGVTNEIYTPPMVCKLEWLFGKSWITHSGETTLKKLISQAEVKDGDRVLDVGCGIGGSSCHLARNYSVSVHGVDLSTNMICTAMERQDSLDQMIKERIQFEAADLSEVEFEKESYDIIILGFDSLFSFKDKKKMITKFYSWLKPGGKLLMAENCEGVTSSSEELQEILNLFETSLMPIDVYEKVLKDSGFSEISARDDSGRAISDLKEAMATFIQTQETFEKEFSQGEFQEILGWVSKKLNWLESNQLTWGIIAAQK